MEDVRREGTGPEAPRKPLSQRACEECKRKKTKCDMKQPICSLCDRIGFDCVYPTRRKPPTRKVNPAVKKNDYSPKVDNEKLSRLIELLNNDKLDNLLNSQLPTHLVSKKSPGSDGSPVTPVGQTNFNQSAPGQTSWINEIDDIASNRNFSQTSFLRPPFSNLGPGGPMHDTTMNADDVAVNQNFATSYNEGLQPSPFEEVLKQQALTIDWNDSTMTDLFENFNQIISTPWQFPGEDSASPESWLAAAENSRAFPLTVSPEIADHLIDLYFEKVQSFLPLFHHPSFHSHVLGSNSVTNDRYQHLDWQACLVLNAMFSLAVRFSPRDDIFGEDLKDRAIPFEKRSVQLWDYARRTNAGDNPDLRYLQGSILVAGHLLTAGPSFRAWLATGVCVRMAYDLGLHVMDRMEVDANQQHPSDWAKEEEKRRAWWSVFEIDTFASTISCQPFVTDMNRMNVLLPVSDDDWFNLKCTPSAQLLSSGPALAWKSLVGCPNQSEHAWFIVSNYIMRSSHEVLESGELTDEVLDNLLSAMQCLSLALPKNFRLSNIVYDDNNFGEMNWIIHTHFMIQSANIFVALLQGNEPHPTNANEQAADRGSQGAHQQQQQRQMTLYEQAVERCARYTYELYRVTRHWSPDYLHQGYPFMACILLGPAAINLSRAPQPVQIDGKENWRFLQRQLLDLILEKVAEYWIIGGLLQDLVRFMDQGIPLNKIAEVRPELARFRVINPELTHRPTVPRASANRQSGPGT